MKAIWVAVALAMAGCSNLTVGALADASKESAFDMTVGSADAIATGDVKPDVGKPSKGDPGIVTNCKVDGDCGFGMKGNICDGIWECYQGQCRIKPGSVVTCQTAFDLPCRRNLCDPMTGKCAVKTLADGAACDDGRTCNDTSTCQGGECKPGAPLVCPAGYGCGGPDGSCQGAAEDCSKPFQVTALPFKITTTAPPKADLGCASDETAFAQGYVHWYEIRATNGTVVASVDSPKVSVFGAISQPSECANSNCRLSTPSASTSTVWFVKGLVGVASNVDGTVPYTLTIDCEGTCGAEDCGFDACGHACGTCAAGSQCVAGRCKAPGTACQSPLSFPAVPSTLHVDAVLAASAIGVLPSCGQPLAGSVLPWGGDASVILGFTPTTTAKYRFVASGEGAIKGVELVDQCPALAFSAAGQTLAACLGQAVSDTATMANAALTATLEKDHAYRLVVFSTSKWVASEGGGGSNEQLPYDVSVCKLNCEGKVCGDDGCGGTCGTCEFGCAPDQKSCCENTCGDKVCGPNTCGQSCGACPATKVCGPDQKSCVTPKGDTCADPFAIGTLPFTAKESTLGRAGDYAAILCDFTGLQGVGSPDQAWRYDAKKTGTLSVTVHSQFDAVAYAKQDCAAFTKSCVPGNLVPAAMNASFDVPVEAGQTWHVIVDGMAGSAGAYTLDVDFATCKPNCAGKSCGSDGCGGSCEKKGSCDDNDPCTTDGCNINTGACTHAPTTGACNDGDACTTSDACAAGTCSGSAISCDDSEPCTVDSCDNTTGCKHTPAADGQACGSGMVCKSAVCVSGTPTPPSGMVYIPAGKFEMGCIAGDLACEADEKPPHTITLPAFFIDLNEVSFIQYQWCVDAGKCPSPGSTAGCNFGKVTFPINCVTWAQADAYCAWKGKRLPSEAEWERAARGGLEGKPYAWGDAAPSCSLAAYGDCGLSASLQLGSKPPGNNAYGMLDVAGNVSEWVADWYDAAYYATSPGSSPKGAASSASGDHVRRGGSYLSPPSALRLSDRDASHGSGPDTGFRCAQ